MRLDEMAYSHSIRVARLWWFGVARSTLSSPPSSGIPESRCFYSCPTSLVGGNGTVWASSKTGCTYSPIDAASTPGYITAP